MRFIFLVIALVFSFQVVLAGDDPSKKPSPEELKSRYLNASNAVLDLLERSTYNDGDAFLTPPKDVEDPHDLYQELGSAMKGYFAQFDDPASIHIDFLGEYYGKLLDKFEKPIKEHSPEDWKDVRDHVQQQLDEKKTSYRWACDIVHTMVLLATHPDKRFKLCERIIPRFFLFAQMLTSLSKNWKNPYSMRDAHSRIGFATINYASFHAFQNFFPHFSVLLSPYSQSQEDIIFSVPDNSGAMGLVGYAVKPLKIHDFIALPKELAYHDLSHIVLMLLRILSLKVMCYEIEKPFDLFDEDNKKELWSHLKSGFDAYTIVVNHIKTTTRKSQCAKIKQVFFRLLHETKYDLYILICLCTNAHALKKNILQKWNKFSKILGCSKDDLDEFCDNFIASLDFSEEEKSQLLEYCQDYNPIHGINLNILVSGEDKEPLLKLYELEVSLSFTPSLPLIWGIESDDNVSKYNDTVFASNDGYWFNSSNVTLEKVICCESPKDPKGNNVRCVSYCDWHFLHQRKISISLFYNLFSNLWHQQLQHTPKARVDFDLVQSVCSRNKELKKPFNQRELEGDFNILISNSFYDVYGRTGSNGIGKFNSKTWYLH